jgi:hypothetical protein
MKSWQTTATGIIQFLMIAWSQVSLLFDGIDTTNPDYNILAASFVTMIGLFRARDNNVSSEDAGAK